MIESSEKFEGWAVVEVMGHKRLAGRCCEVNIAGAGMLRVDVPETVHERQALGPVDAPQRMTKAGYTQFIGGASIYRLTHCTEEVAVAAAHELERYNDPLPVALPRQLAPVSGASREAPEDAEFEIDEDEEVERPF